jgi:DNA-binding NtrC family response regulator
MLIGRSDAFLRAMRKLDRFAAVDAPALLGGETGTGKELAARHLHYTGPRRAGPFVPVNCGAIPDGLAENELFGHDRGAFTDARSESPGCVTLARGGTLFLDEVDALSQKSQVSLLRFLQDYTYRPLGSRSECRADVRIVAASNVNLEALAARGQFRKDLFFRINLLYVEMPPLRVRDDDVLLLANYFLDHVGRVYGTPIKRLSTPVSAWLRRHDWPGNVRELENVVHRAALLTDGEAIRLEELAPADAAGDRVGAATQVNYRIERARALEAFHRRFLAQIVSAAGGNLSSASRLCGADRRVLGRLLKRYGMLAAELRER